MIKMSSMKFIARLDASHQGPSHPSKDAGVVADSLTGIHNAMCLFVVNRSCIHNGFTCPHRQTSRGFKSGERGGHALFSYTYPSVMIGTTENISHGTAKMYRSNIMHYFDFFLMGWDWVHLVQRPLFGQLYQPRTIDDYDCGAIDGMRICRGNRSTRIKPAPVPLCPPQIPHDLTRARTRVAAVGSRRLTAHELWHGHFHATFQL
jgi:hypothetical protein